MPSPAKHNLHPQDLKPLSADLLGGKVWKTEALKPIPSPFYLPAL